MENGGYFLGKKNLGGRGRSGVVWGEGGLWCGGERGVGVMGIFVSKYIGLC